MGQLQAGRQQLYVERAAGSLGVGEGKVFRASHRGGRRSGGPDIGAGALPHAHPGVYQEQVGPHGFDTTGPPGFASLVALWLSVGYGADAVRNDANESGSHSLSRI